MVATATTATATTVWTLDAGHSLAEFAVKHMMVSTAKGRFSDLSGTIELDERDVTRSNVDVTINVASINTHDEKRDAHLKSGDFFEAEHFPTITFKSTKVQANGENRLRVIGDLTIKGITMPVELDTELNGRGVSPWGAEVIAYSAEAAISRKDFGLTWNVGLEAGGVLVGDRVKIAIEAQAIKQS